MKRIIISIVAILLCSAVVEAKKPRSTPKTDREVWVDIMYQMAEPVLKNMAEGKLQQNMTVENGGLELSPTWDNRDKKVSILSVAFIPTRPLISFFAGMESFLSDK